MRKWCDRSNQTSHNLYAKYDQITLSELSPAQENENQKRSKFQVKHIFFNNTYTMIMYRIYVRTCFRMIYFVIRKYHNVNMLIF